MNNKKLKGIQPMPETSLRRRALAVMSVIGLSLSAVAGICPGTSENVSVISLPEMSATGISEVNIISPADYVAMDTAGLADVPGVTVAEEDEEDKDAKVFSYCFDDTVVSAASVKYERTNVEEVKKEIEEIKEEEREREAAKALSYIRLNANAVPMSDMVAPDYIKFDSNGLPINYSYCIEGAASAYCTGTLTATGTYVHQGSVAINPAVIPYGKMMYIVSLDGQYVYGYCRAEDTGGFVWNGSGRVADLYMNSYADCMAWGVRGVRIYVF